MLRERAGLTQAELAEVLGNVSRPSVSRWESGCRRPRGQLLEQYLALLDQLAAAGRVEPETREARASRRQPLANVDEDRTGSR